MTLEQNGTLTNFTWNCKKYLGRFLREINFDEVSICMGWFENFWGSEFWFLSISAISNWQFTQNVNLELTKNVKKASFWSFEIFKLDFFVKSSYKSCSKFHISNSKFSVIFFCEIINSKICEAKLKINCLYFFREISFKNVENPLYILFFVKSSNLQKISLIQRKIWFLITVILQRISLSRLFNQLVVV